VGRKDSGRRGRKTRPFQRRGPFFLDSLEEFAEVGVVKRTVAEAIVNFLSFSGETSAHVGELAGFNDREWRQAVSWLHDAGLALYLLQKLKQGNVTDIVPTTILSRLEENLTANRRRVAYMAHQFEFLNQRLNAASVRYAAVKGFSLVPQFCPDASLRHQSDFDYLVDHRSLPLAQTVLEEAGYFLSKHKANEFVFLMPSRAIPPPDDAQYEAHAPHAVELRVAFWDSDFHGVFLTGPRFSVDNTKTQRWQDSVFPALPEEDAFLLQVIHAFNHVLAGWVRMSWLYEIGYFLNQRSTDKQLWQLVERRIGDNALLREIVIVVTELSAHFFKAPLPTTSIIWAQKLDPAVRIWIKNYARRWVFAKNRVDQLGLFSAAKVVLFLHQQYLPDASVRRHQMRLRLLPWEQLFRRAGSITSKSLANSGERRRQLKHALIRFLFHATAGLRYLWEVPRWRRLNKASARLSCSTKPELPVAGLVGAQSPESTLQS